MQRPSPIRPEGGPLPRSWLVRRSFEAGPAGFGVRRGKNAERPSFWCLPGKEVSLREGLEDIGSGPGPKEQEVDPDVSLDPNPNKAKGFGF